MPEKRGAWSSRAFSRARSTPKRCTCSQGSRYTNNQYKNYSHVSIRLVCSDASTHPCWPLLWAPSLGAKRSFHTAPQRRSQLVGGYRTRRRARLMTLLGNFVQTREEEEKSLSCRNMIGMRSSSKAISFLMSTLLLLSHASFAPFVPHWTDHFLLVQTSPHNFPTESSMACLQRIDTPLHRSALDRTHNTFSEVMGL